MKLSSRITVIMVIAALLCLGMGKPPREKQVYCPKCKKRVVMHRVAGRSTRRHRHVRYICPSCLEEWTGSPGETAKEEPVCPTCGYTIKECPDCRKKRSK